MSNGGPCGPLDPGSVCLGRRVGPGGPGSPGSPGSPFKVCRTRTWRSVQSSQMIFFLSKKKDTIERRLKQYSRLWTDLFRRFPWLVCLLRPWKRQFITSWPQSCQNYFINNQDELDFYLKEALYWNHVRSCNKKQTPPRRKMRSPNLLARRLHWPPVRSAGLNPQHSPTLEASWAALELERCFPTRKGSVNLLWNRIMLNLTDVYEQTESM